MSPSMPAAPAPPPPTVVGLTVAPARHAPLVDVDRVVAETAAGLVGDRFHGSRHRHVSVQSATSVAEAAEVLGRPLDPRATRRNVTLSHGVVPAEPGTRFHVGEVELEVVRVAAPCHVLDEAYGEGARAALRRRAGSVCRVVAGGEIRLGDPAHLG